MLKKVILFLILLYPVGSIFAQSGNVIGIISSPDGVLPFATIKLLGTEFGAKANSQGEYKIGNVPFGSYQVQASFVGYPAVIAELTISELEPLVKLDFKFDEVNYIFDEVVVTGTKTEKRQTDSPIIVNVLSSQRLDNVQACNLSDGLKFQPGLRVETDCQTCNYTQLRMNGLAGGYSQILINGRPIFSPLTGLYGMEQLPVNMIDRIEVVRGGGSSLYGSSAIGGTVNVITKIPKKNAYGLNYNYQQINGQTSDHQLLGNGTVVNAKKNMGASLFVNYRNREFYDHNEDNFSELPLIQNKSVGFNAFYLPKTNQKLELSLSFLNEYRFGGEMVLQPAYAAEQAEERTHNVLMGSVDYQIHFNENKSTVILYTAIQNTFRKHYTGILPDSEEELDNHYESPPYGTSYAATYNAGMQVNHKLNNFLKGVNVLTFGSEFLYDDVNDNIPVYNYLIDQITTDFAMFLQSDWEIIPSLTLLSGVRVDFHSFVDNPVLSPRLSLFYKLKNNTQFRLNYGSGFRAPQAFDADLHIAFAGGGVSRITLSPDLSPENSQSFSFSINYDKPKEHFITGFTLEGFHTRLNNVFYLQPIGADNFGERFEKRNGQGATVQGATVELRANFDKKVQIESGFTIQTSRFDNPVDYIEGVSGIRNFIRAPQEYGFATLSFTPNKKLSINLNYIYTGKMQVPHFAGAPNQKEDEIITSPSFSELSAKVAYTFPVSKIKSNIQFYTGVKNVLNAYQSDFDIGKNRDSNYIYGPSQPRTFYIGFKISSL